MNSSIIVGAIIIFWALLGVTTALEKIATAIKENKEEINDNNNL